MRALVFTVLLTASAAATGPAYRRAGRALRVPATADVTARFRPQGDVGPHRQDLRDVCGLRNEGTMIQTTAIRAAAAAVPWRAVAAIGLAVLSFGIGWTVNGWRKDSQIDRLTSQQAEERKARAYAQVKAVEAARLEEQRRTAAQMEIANAATEELEGARRDARAAGAAAERLRSRVAELVAAGRAGQNSGAASPGTSTDDPIGMLADVLSRADSRAGILAEYADAARVAGTACERAYDALGIR